MSQPAQSVEHKAVQSTGVGTDQLRIIDALPSGCILGAFLIAVNDDEQRLGDMAASTYVVKG